jgi:hypothetical protein
MPAPTDRPERDRAILLALLMLTLFASPAVSWWLDTHPPWFLPYLLWLAVIALAAWQARTPRPRKRSDEH